MCLSSRKKKLKVQNRVWRQGLRKVNIEILWVLRQSLSASIVSQILSLPHLCQIRPIRIIETYFYKEMRCCVYIMPVQYTAINRNCRRDQKFWTKTLGSWCFWCPQTTAVNGLIDFLMRYVIVVYFDLGMRIANRAKNKEII